MIQQSQSGFSPHLIVHLPPSLISLFYIHPVLIPRQINLTPMEPVFAAENFCVRCRSHLTEHFSDLTPISGYQSSFFTVQKLCNICQHQQNSNDYASTGDHDLPDALLRFSESGQSAKRSRSSSDQISDSVQSELASLLLTASCEQIKAIIRYLKFSDQTRILQSMHLS
jgi:hypothetical protein